MRGTLSLLAAMVALSWCANASAAEPHTQKVLHFANLSLSARSFDDVVLRRGRASQANGTAYHAGVYQTRDGIAVHVYTSDSYPVSPAADQSAVDFLGSLLHGPELGLLTLYIATPDEVHHQCGFGATACYSPTDESLYAPGEDSDGLPVEQILAHEYGHHIASNRVNTPWSAGTWGPKRWATYMGICVGVDNGSFSPGAEPPRGRYTMNPGEGWAEAYRAYNERVAKTWPYFGWPIVDNVFKPDERAFATIADDVLRPWMRNTTTTQSGRLRAHATTHIAFETPLDGALAARVSGTASPSVQVAELDGTTMTTARRRVTTTICGENRVTIVLHARRSGTYEVTVSAP